MVFEAFKEPVQGYPHSMKTIRKVLDTIMALNKILVEYCVKRLTVKDVNEGCVFPQETLKEDKLIKESKEKNLLFQEQITFFQEEFKIFSL